MTKHEHKLENDVRSASRSDQRKHPSGRKKASTMIAPALPGLNRANAARSDRSASAASKSFGRSRSAATQERGAASPPIAVVRMSDGKTPPRVRRSSGGELFIEADCLLRARHCSAVCRRNFQATALDHSAGLRLHSGQSGF